MQNKNWYHNLRLKLLVVLCAVLLLGQGLFIRPALASPAAANDARPLADTDPDVDARYAVITRGAGKLDCFMVHGGEIWMKSFNGSWTNWSNLGKAPTGENFVTVAAVAAGNNRWDIFGTSNTTNVVYHLAFDGTFLWSWESMGSVGNVAFEGVQAVSSGNGQITLLTRTTRHSAYSPWVFKTWTASGGWKPSQTGWTALDNTGSYFTVFALAHSGNQLGFFRQMDSTSNPALGYKSWNGTRWMQLDRNGLWFNQWADLSSGLSYKTPYAVSWGPNRVDVFARGTDGNAYINSTDSASNGGGWYGWASLGKVNAALSGGAPTGAITAVAWGPNRLDIFTREASTYYYKAWTGSFWYPSQTTWENIATIPGDYTWNYSPIPVSWGPNRIDLFAFDSNIPTSGTLYHKYTDGNGWFPTGGNGWESLGHP